jgi:anti-sigma factor RsiW
MTGTAPIPEEDLVRFHAGALTGAERATIAALIMSDPAAQALLAEWDRQDGALSAAYDPVLKSALPGTLRAMLDTARSEDRRQARRRMAAPLRVAAAIALLAVGGAGGYVLARVDGAATAPAHFAQNALSAYATYVVEVAHPVEVEAARADHLTQWLSKRLGHPIKAPDFAASGFRLMGGRLLPSDSGPAALFMYEDDLGRRITLYVTPGAKGDETAFRFLESGTTQSFYWIDGDLSCAVTGDIPRDVLRQIAVEAYAQLI